ncbi:hypothetical protein FOA43_003603 [Brettanomyces nanus]|uniref:Uncharacterized protein n=1 Tax=Eeniella nana TaxID=13502 RepID=A0A875RWB9_EENNA|nr:uncharacterized protein FOA43_003603 [Brettanomyces nanus]QPG76217.1 hypothetical protein FOA43_003603 [Brettanomyces nanus]
MVLKFAILVSIRIIFARENAKKSKLLGFNDENNVISSDLPYREKSDQKGASVKNAYVSKFDLTDLENK